MFFRVRLEFKGKRGVNYLQYFEKIMKLRNRNLDIADRNGVMVMPKS